MDFFTNKEQTELMYSLGISLRQSPLKPYGEVLDSHFYIVNEQTKEPIIFDNVSVSELFNMLEPYLLLYLKEKFCRLNIDKIEGKWEIKWEDESGNALAKIREDTLIDALVTAIIFANNISNKK